MEQCLEPVTGWQGGGEYTSPDGLVTLSIDYGDEDYHIDARPGHTTAGIRAALEQAKARGLEVMDEDECEPEILEDGTVRLYLAIAVQPVTIERQIIPVPAQVRRLPRKRSMFGFAVAASLFLGVMVPSPLRHFFPDMPNFDRETTQSIPMGPPGTLEVQTVSDEQKGQ